MQSEKNDYLKMEGEKHKNNFIINSLSHCDWKDCPEQLVELVQGKKVLLVVESGNVDPNAVRVHFDSKVAGYVCREDAPQVRSLILDKDRHSAIALVTDYITDPYYKLKGEIEGADMALLSIDDRLNQQYDAWEYTGPLLPLSQEQKLLEGAVEYLSYVIGGELEWDAESNSYFDTFLRFHRQDNSDEMFNFRHQLVKYFEGNSGMDRERRLMEQELHEMSKHEHRESIVRYIDSLTATPEFQQIMLLHGNFDMPTLMKQMASFPENLTGLLLKDRVSFANRLYYIHPRRKVLMRFFSGIAILLFLGKNGFLQQPMASTAGQLNTQPLAGLDRLANQLNVVLGQNPNMGY